MTQNLDALHATALHANAVLDDLSHQSTSYLTELRLSIHAYSGPDTSGLNSVFADRLDNLLAERS